MALLDNTTLHLPKIIIRVRLANLLPVTNIFILLILVHLVVIGPPGLTVRRPRRPDVLVTGPVAGILGQIKRLSQERLSALLLVHARD